MTYSANQRVSQPIPAEPGVLSVYCTNSDAATDMLVYVPWKNCRLAYAYTVVGGTAIDATGDMVLTLELNAAGGTDMMSITVASSSAVGTIDEATIVTPAACRGLDVDNSSRDAINIEIDGSAAAAGAVMLYMYFEHDYGV